MKKLISILSIIVFTSQFLRGQTVPEVYAVGAMKDMGNTYDLKVWLDTLPQKSHLYGMGPYDRMKGEITVVDGKPFHASAFETGKALVGQSWDIRSPFFVYSHVPKWEAIDLDGPLNSVQEIQEKVAALAETKGYNLKEPFAFRITGQFDEMTIHIVTPRNPEVEGYKPDVKSQKFTSKNEKGQLVGFYSEQHQGIFTGSKSFVHVHFLKDDQSFMGHLDKINSGARSFTLYLPKRENHIKTGMRVNDTDFSKGRLGNVQDIDLNDLVKFHGHLCDGLVVGHLALQEALGELYQDGPIDRTNTRIVSQPSPCLTDAAIYDTGARYQFNTFYVSKDIDGLFTVQRIDTQKAVTVRMNQGVKPGEIDKLGALAVKGELPPCELDKLRKMEDDFTETLLSTDPKNNFTVTETVDFKWKPVLRNDFIKTDILNKDTSECKQKD
ncbi:acetolactate decarboxylase [Zobellia galactanivorans]|uniref:FmdE family protein n=1 Tax=Zobellia galactanivorans (strain DSM 12802 / CCUG 47099 / CIP 106680 / NCIMB 13871 / Dsij) TaxID=63186 RepID=UPI0026E48948|nr:FmdE family protein [Zobellia galactanivorans]MDO6808937.1 acetolactate decarboxylase [Zobellia galactanivorans]